MAASLILAPEVENDLAKAYAWYEEQQVGLGEDFLTCVDACFQRICRSPELFEKVHEDYRRALVSRFPYMAFFDYLQNTVTVYCVFHTARDPQKWRERLK